MIAFILGVLAGAAVTVTILGVWLIAALVKADEL